jgi:hypothetical protein
LKNWIKNTEGQSTSNEVTPEYFGAKGALSLKNENIMCDTSMYFSPFRYNHFTTKTTFSQINSIYLKIAIKSHSFSDSSALSKQPDASSI